jgi:hypothetical protein
MKRKIHVPCQSTTRELENHQRSWQATYEIVVCRNGLVGATQHGYGLERFISLAASYGVNIFTVQSLETWSRTRIQKVKGVFCVLPCRLREDSCVLFSVVVGDLMSCFVGPSVMWGWKWLLLPPSEMVGGNVPCAIGVQSQVSTKLTVLDETLPMMFQSVNTFKYWSNFYDPQYS